MSSTTKKVLWGVGIALALGLLLIGCCVGGAYLWVAQNAPRIRQMGTEAEAEARTFAASHDQEACLDEGLRKVDVCGAGGVFCEVEAQVFTQRCLGAATATPGLCTGIPPSTQIMDTAQWSIRWCAGRGRASSQPCTRFSRTLQQHCERPR